MPPFLYTFNQNLLNFNNKLLILKDKKELINVILNYMNNINKILIKRKNQFFETNKQINFYLLLLEL